MRYISLERTDTAMSLSFLRIVVSRVVPVALIVVGVGRDTNAP